MLCTLPNLKTGRRLVGAKGSGMLYAAV